MSDAACIIISVTATCDCFASLPPPCLLVGSSGGGGGVARSGAATAHTACAPHSNTHHCDQTQSNAYNQTQSITTNYNQSNRYVEALQKLYDDHKERFHKGRASELRLVE